MTWARTAALAAALVAAACAYNPPPVPIEARPADLAMLSGRWSGTYHGDGSGRSGSIELTLLAGEGHAHGDVLMVAQGSRRAHEPWRETAPVREASTTEVLTIRFVAVENGEITGELDPYRDPACDCRAVTSFRGRIDGGVIAGSFVTYAARAAGPAHGTWKVRRERR